MPRRAQLLAAAVVLATAALAHAERRPPELVTEAPPALAAVDVEEHLGAHVPLDLAFRDQHGRDVTLGDYVRGDLPVILTFNYSSCPMLCSLQLDGFVDGLGKLSLAAGVQFRIVTIVIEPKEEPARAAQTRTAYLEKLETRRAGYRRHAEAGGWTFLVARDGSDAAIRRLADTVGIGYRYVPERAEWAHPAALVFLSPSGIVTRYVHGIQYDHDDLLTSVMLAGTAEPAAAVGFVQRCFHWDPNAGGRSKSAFSLMKFGAVAFGAFVLGALILVHVLRRGVPRS